MTHPIRLFDLGLVPAVRSQTIYHAVGHALTPALKMPTADRRPPTAVRSLPSAVCPPPTAASFSSPVAADAAWSSALSAGGGADSPDTIILVAPASPYVCIGYHQDLEREVDLDYCRQHGLPVVRREVGGGAVYLDAGQLFCQWVFHRDALPASLEAKFELYIRPLVETYQALGVAAYHRPVNDIHVAGKKIGGTGAAQMGEAEVLVGSLMFTFDKATMARVLKVSSEKMRDKIFESLEQYMTTLAEQLPVLPDLGLVRDLYLARASAALGREIVPGEPTAAELALAAELDEHFISEEWLYQKGRLRRGGVKIHADVYVTEGAFKAPGGLIRATVRLREGRIDGLELAGDFTVFPAAALGALQMQACGVALSRAALTERFAGVYRDLAIQAPGVTPAHLAEAVLAAAGSGAVQP